MLWRVDQGEAANISGVPDPDLKVSLAQLLELLRLRRNDKVRARVRTGGPEGVAPCAQHSQVHHTEGLDSASRTVQVPPGIFANRFCQRPARSSSCSTKCKAVRRLSTPRRGPYQPGAAPQGSGALCGPPPSDAVSQAASRSLALPLLAAPAPAPS